MRILKSALANSGSDGPFASSDPDGHIVQWAFAGKTGTREINKPGGKGGPYKHSVWEHWIDSKSTTTTTPEPDEADLYTLPNGDVLERGKQSHPTLAAGKECEYEELWSNLEIQAIPGERINLEEEGESKRVSVVFRAEDQEGKVVGMVVRVGSWVQGVMRNKDGSLGVERWCWKWVEEEGNEERGWRCLVKIGDGMMPCPTTFDGTALFLKEGQKLPLSGGVWTVVELCRW